MDALLNGAREGLEPVTSMTCGHGMPHFDRPRVASIRLYLVPLNILWLRSLVVCYKMSSTFWGKILLRIANATGQRGRLLQNTGAWMLAALVPAAFLVCLGTLAIYASPENDDYCAAFLYVRDGFVQTVAGYYQRLSGRVVPLLVLQFPAAIAKTTGISILQAYSLTLVAFGVLLVAGCALAVARAWRSVSGIQLLALMLALPAAIAGATPSVHDLLYWLPAVICYGPPGAMTIVVLGECFDALWRDRAFSAAATKWITAGVFFAAMCNEFTSVWIIAILASSFAGRYAFGQPPELGRHAVIVVAAVVGWLVVVAAPGNSVRAATVSDAWHLGQALRLGFDGYFRFLGKLLLAPSIIGWLILVGAVTAFLPDKEKVRINAVLPLGIAVICFLCGYLENALHVFLTGTPLVERAQNQLLILVAFAAALIVSCTVSISRSMLPPQLASNASFAPIALALIIVVSIWFSATATMIRREWASFVPFLDESRARDRYFTVDSAPIVTVAGHAFRPSVVFGVDITVHTACVALYYRKADIIVSVPKDTR